MSFNEVAPLIEPTIRDLGFDLVQVRMMGGSRRTLQVMAEPVDRARVMTVEDCAAISRAVSLTKTRPNCLYVGGPSA